MNKFEFLLNLDQYRNYKPKNVLYHDSYDIPKKETHKIQPGYSRAPKIYKDQISLYEEYNSEVIAHRGDMKYYQKIENFYGPGKSRYFYSKEEWDAYQDEKNKMYDKARAEVSARDAAMKNSQKQKIHTIDPRDDRIIEYDEDGSNARKLNTTWQQHRQGAIMEADKAIERSLKEGGMKSGINAILRDDRMEEFFTQFEGGFENHGWDLTEDDKITGMSDDDKKYVKDVENWARKFTDSEGNSLFESDEFQDAVMKEIKNRYKIAQDLKNDPDREKKDAEEDAYWKKENRKAGEAMEKALKSVHKEEKIKRIETKLNKLGEGGNVDLNNRPEISTKELEKAGWNDVGDGYATVFSSTYSNENEDTFYNFTPIIVDPKTGKFLGVMSPKEFEQYCYDVIDGKRKDDYNLQIGGAFTGDKALENAEKAAQKIHDLHEKKHNL